MAWRPGPARNSRKRRAQQLREVDAVVLAWVLPDSASGQSMDAPPGPGMAVHSSTNAGELQMRHSCMRYLPLGALGSSDTFTQRTLKPGAMYLSTMVWAASWAISIPGSRGM